MTEVMADLDGRWLGLNLSSESWVILEAPRGCPDHIKSMSCINKASWQERDLLKFINHGLFISHQRCLKVLTLQQCLVELENVGEVDCKVIGHTIQQEGASTVITSEEAICFVLDNPRRSKKKQKATSTLIPITFHSPSSCQFLSCPFLPHLCFDFPLVSLHLRRSHLEARLVNWQSSAQTSISAQLGV